MLVVGLGACGRTELVRFAPAETGAGGGSGGGSAVRGNVVGLALGAQHTCALLGDGRVKCWGDNQHGQLGLGDTLERGGTPDTVPARLPAVDLGTGEVALQLVAGNSTTCALLASGRLKCWGWNPSGILGLGDTTDRGVRPGQMGDALAAVNLGRERRALRATVGNYHACALLDDNTLKCWGQAPATGLEQLENRGHAPGTMGDALSPVGLGAGNAPVGIKAGYGGSCALFPEGRLKCWGSNSTGQLGLGDKVDRGGRPGSMGDALPFVDVGSTRRVLAVAPSSYSTCALLDDNTVKCWGIGADLGLGSQVARGDRPGSMGDVLPAVDLPTPVLRLESGARWTCGLAAATQQLLCWGDNRAGQLGVGSLDAVGDEPGEMGTNLPPLDLGTGHQVLSFSLGAAHGCAILEDATVKCWGANDTGQLGLGDHAFRGDQPGELGDNLPVVDLE